MSFSDVIVPFMLAGMLTSVAVSAVLLVIVYVFGFSFITDRGTIVPLISSLYSSGGSTIPSCFSTICIFR